MKRKFDTQDKGATWTGRLNEELGKSNLSTVRDVAATISPNGPGGGRFRHGVGGTAMPMEKSVKGSF